MAKSTETDNTENEQPPQEFASVPAPRNLYATSDIRFVILEIGKLTEQVVGFDKKLDKLDTKLTKISTTLDRVKTGAIVAGFLVTVFSGLLWWALGDRINSVRDTLLNPPPNAAFSFHPSK